MSVNDLPDDETSIADLLDSDGATLLSPLLKGERSARWVRDGPELLHGSVVGELLAVTDDGRVPLVRHHGCNEPAALRARTMIDLHGQHIGSLVVLVFETGDPSLPIVVGLLRGTTSWATQDLPAQVEIDADGERMIVSAREQLVVRCGKASITLTKAGKVLIEGS